MGRFVVLTGTRNGGQIRRANGRDTRGPTFATFTRDQTLVQAFFFFLSISKGQFIFLREI
jgi:hypothetical protein